MSSVLLIPKYECFDIFSLGKSSTMIFIHCFDNYLFIYYVLISSFNLSSLKSCKNIIIKTVYFVYIKDNVSDLT